MKFTSVKDYDWVMNYLDRIGLQSNIALEKHTVPTASPPAANLSVNRLPSGDRRILPSPSPVIAGYESRATVTHPSRKFTTELQGTTAKEEQPRSYIQGLDSSPIHRALHRPLSSATWIAPRPSPHTPTADVMIRPSTAQPYNAISSSSVAYNFSHGSQSSPITVEDATVDAPSHRPSTSPLEALENDLTAMIPPRRDLPFSRPASRQTRRPSVVLDLPALPQPNVRSTGVAEGGSSATISPKQGDQASKAGSKRKKHIVADRSSRNTQSSETQVKRSKIDPLEAIAVSGPEVQQRSTVTLPDSSGALVTAPVSVDTSSDSALPSLRPIPESPLMFDHSAASPQQSLTQYVQLPPESRRASIDRLILQMLQDENFTTFVEDVQACWRRRLLEPRNATSSAS